LRVNSQQGSAIAAGAIRGAHLAVGRNGRVHVAWNGSSTGPTARSAQPGNAPGQSPQRGPDALFPTE
jgi:hypothetical protein